MADEYYLMDNSSQAMIRYLRHFEIKTGTLARKGTATGKSKNGKKDGVFRLQEPLPFLSYHPLKNPWNKHIFACGLLYRVKNLLTGPGSKRKKHTVKASNFVRGH